MTFHRKGQLRPMTAQNASGPAAAGPLFDETLNFFDESI
jgi:hypothetical protein